MIERINPYVLIAIGGALGAVSRFWVSGVLKNALAIPLGTLTVNTLGSFLLGFLITLYSFNMVESHWIILFGTGFCGSFTTMSTFVVETSKLGESSYNLALLNFALTLVFAFIGGFVGQSLGMGVLRRSI